MSKALLNKHFKSLVGNIQDFHHKDILTDILKIFTICLEVEKSTY